jgi:signal transduction histidine kinase
VQQSVRNLVSNALAYGTPDTPVRVTLRGEASDVRLEVTNSGPTIDPSTMSAIFDPLMRVVAQENQENPGSLGLGLFIVREIAHAHGGEVEVRSEDGETTFSLRLPRHPKGVLTK